MRLAGADRDRVHGSGERLALADAPLVVRFYRSLITRAGGAA